MSQDPHILIVDDERDIRDPLAKYLEKNGFRVSRAENAAAARQILAGYAIDLVVLDIMMPGEDGISLCRHVGATSDIPVILLTALADDTDRIVGLEIGADDYVVKPFNPRELVARIKAILRRSGDRGSRLKAPDGGAYAFGPWVFKVAERELVGADGVAVGLTTGDFNLLLALVRRPHQVLARDQLLDLAHGREMAAFDRSIDNQVSRLRKKIEADPADPKLIKTVWGGGYMLAADVRTL